MDTKYRFKKNHILHLDNRVDGSISNNNMTDEKAIAFLKVNPNRIKLFSKYPNDWRESLSEEAVEVKEEVVSDDLKTASEAIIEALEDAQEVKKPCSPCEKKRLLNMKMGELRETYPNAEVHFGMTKEQLVDNIVDKYYS